MKPLIVILFLTTTAAAQQRLYAPITIDEPTFNQLMNLLGEVPAKYSIAIISILQQREATASAPKPLIHHVP